MKRKLVAIGLDGADALLLEKWMSQGYLPNLLKLRQQGGFGHLSNTVNLCDAPEDTTFNDTLWPSFITGCRADTTGYWSATQYDPSSYRVTCDQFDSGYDYQDYPPFYALGDAYKVAVFDIPYAKLSDQVNGLQVLGWGGHFPYSPSVSEPSDLFAELISKYGENSLIFKDDGSWSNLAYIKWECKALQASIAGHVAICCDLLSRDDWDLFLVVFGESHTAGHDLYSYSQPDHPLYPYLMQKWTFPDPLLDAYRALDQAVGDIMTTIPQDSYVVCFSPNGMGPNFSEMLCQVFLPEILYRFNFPGQAAIAPSQIGTPLPPPITNPIRTSWPGNIWVKLHEPNPFKRFIKTWTHKSFLRSRYLGLRSPYSEESRDVGMGWMPAMWFQPLWPTMKAFALPGFPQGNIRINLQNRERDGIVPPAEYETLCEELTQILYRLQDARTSKAIVKKVVRTRRSPMENSAKLPDADLIVYWHEHTTDTIDSPDFGRVGPLEYFRAGSHWNRGFLMAKGVGIEPGSDLPNGDIVDLPPTILDIIGAPIPQHFDGKSLLNCSSPSEKFPLSV
jgi:predicted AlkP superfamily phosphohydrolase/phosphomutase